jgi:predicted ester cyclase
MSVKQNKAILIAIIEEIFNKGNLSQIPGLIDTSWTYHSPFGEQKGPEGYKQQITADHSAFPDARITIEDIIGEGDKLAGRFTWRGTFTGNMGDIKPTGKKVEMKFAFFTRYANGKEVEVIEFSDPLSFYRQLGITPPE